MNDVVVDASIALAWCFPDEKSDYAEAVLIALEGKQILVPAVWSLEITNAIIVAQKRKRINPKETQRFIELLEGLTIREAVLAIAWSANNILPLAQEYNLSAYDAAYLSIAIRHDAPLATLDNGLTSAALKAGIEIFSGTESSKRKRTI